MRISCNINHNVTSLFYHTRFHAQVESKVDKMLLVSILYHNFMRKRVCKHPSLSANGIKSWHNAFCVNIIPHFFIKKLKYNILMCYRLYGQFFCRVKIGISVWGMLFQILLNHKIHFYIQNMCIICYSLVEKGEGIDR